MSIVPSPELLTEAAGVKIFMTPLSEEHSSNVSSVTGKICVTLENIKEAKSCGFHLTKSKWDPYPWVSCVETESLADAAGLRAGDCLVSINGKDLIGLKIKEIATLIHQHQKHNVNLFVWRYANEEEQQETGIAVKGPLPDVASKLANAVSGVVRALECPVCLDSSMPPVSQCVHGHIICVGCRTRTPRCPVCRVRLGQGRCLLADKLHKIFRDAFEIKNNSCDDTVYRGWSLRDHLFGKTKSRRAPSERSKSNGAILKARQLLLSKLFLGGAEKAASADNLTTVANETCNANEALMNNLKFTERLRLCDRTKSASTGELSREIPRNVNNDHSQTDAVSRMSSTASLMSSVPPTPIWEGSMDSVTCAQIVCPLSKQTDCRDFITSDIVLEHLSGVHDVPQVHFYSIHIQIPLPLPFGVNAVYVIHYGGDLFFLQYDQEAVWISCTRGGRNVWEWTLHGQGENGTEIKLRRSVVSLEIPVTVSTQHIAPLPSALSLHTLNIQLDECSLHEQFDV
ncbi:PREDICTED: uncharacterized protein LOC107189234 [Dufourea novaeangliae]|uniref:Putative E3 ubiquitin-protein ligase sinah n=1 Tax=Dufourea novaeangliae TaxID=178035 RepID=A0A154PGZ5_DUFNO|nr:PREDICTED: uncharacterized protein LOC107189234 [Dufourea novaeangliae]KZC11156.1 putative E3 ubiquitin-protein ligase sinah [Dufourea novaeangliae]